MSAQPRPPEACGCCEPPATEPQLVNRPGLPALRYRAGTYGTFLRRMLARLPSYTITSDENAGTRPLQALTTRAEDDPAIALLDAWAVTADVLTFYQERIANEGFLGTATERRSVLELARAIGYELSSGVAASTFLAFTVEEPVVAPAAAVGPERRAFQNAPGSTAPASAIVPKGTQVQSIPGPGEKPQTFESSVELVARAEWNTLRPRLTREQPVDPEARSVWVEGILTDLKPGGRVLFLTRDSDDDTVATAKRVVAVTPEDALDRTRIDLADNTVVPTYTVVSKPNLTLALPTLQTSVLSKVSVQNQILNKSWTEKSLSAFVGIQKWKVSAVVKHLHFLHKKKTAPPPPSFALEKPEPGLVAFTTKLAAFGHNAPAYATLPEQVRTAYPSNWDTTPPSIAKDSQGNDYLAGGGSGNVPLAHVYLERVVNEVLPGGWVLVESGSVAPRPLRVAALREASLADFALSGRATGLVVQQPDDAQVTSSDLSAFRVRNTSIHAGSRALALAGLRIEDALGKGTQEEAQLTLDGIVPGLAPGKPIAITGERDDLPGVLESEVVIIEEAIHSEGFTTLFFTTGLQHTYVRATVSLNANVVAATHGESVAEVLGSGDAATPNQRFVLKKPPLTHVSTDAPSGALSTLETRVDDVLWRQEPSLYGLGPEDRAYTVRIDDDASATLIFGDGRQGARLPTGAANVIARYRSGIGLGGEVDAAALSVLQARPLGIREVINPVPATGAEDPEKLADARANAPLTVRTLERIVSLRDYADFARGFAGVGKADAVALWNGRGRIVAVSIASASGEVVEETSALATNLASAIDDARAPLEPFRVVSFQPLFFDVRAAVLADAAYDDVKVRAQVEAALLDAFSFTRRGFAQPVTAAEVVTVIHGVAGVLAVDLDALHLTTTAEAPQSVLQAVPARWEGGGVALTQLLLVNPAGVTVTEMSS